MLCHRVKYGQPPIIVTSIRGRWFRVETTGRRCRLALAAVFEDVVVACSAVSAAWSWCLCRADLVYGVGEFRRPACLHPHLADLMQVCTTLTACVDRQRRPPSSDM